MLVQGVHQGGAGFHSCIASRAPSLMPIPNWWSSSSKRIFNLQHVSMLSTGGPDIEIGSDSDGESSWPKESDWGGLDAPGDYGVLHAGAMAEVQKNLENVLDGAYADEDPVSFHGSTRQSPLRQSFPGNDSSEAPKETTLSADGSEKSLADDSVLGDVTTQSGFKDWKELESAFTMDLDDGLNSVPSRDDPVDGVVLKEIMEDMGSSMQSSKKSERTIQEENNDSEKAAGSKRPAHDSWKIEEDSQKRSKSSGRLLVDIDWKYSVRGSKAKSSQDSDLSFLDPAPLSTISQESKGRASENMWLFDEEEERKEGFMVLPTQEASDKDPKNLSRRIRRSAEKREGLWSDTHAGQGIILKTNSGLDLVEQSLVEAVGNDLIDNLRAELSESSPGSVFIKALLASTIETKSPISTRMDKLCVLLQERLPHLAPEEVAITLLAMAKSGYRNGRILREVWCHVLASEMIGKCGPASLAAVYLGTGLLNRLDRPVGKALEDKIIELMDCPAGFSDFPPCAFAGLLYGCSMLWDQKMAGALVVGLVDHVCDEGRLVQQSGWTELAVMLKMCCMYKSVPKQLLPMLYEKLRKNSGSIKATQFVLLLKVICHIMNGKNQRGKKDAKRCVDLLMENARRDDMLSSLEASLVPDVAYCTSLVWKPEVKLMTRLKEVLLDESHDLPTWVLIRKFLEGYSRMYYADDEAFKALNSRLAKQSFKNLGASALSKLIMSGWTMQALEDDVLDKATEALGPGVLSHSRCSPVDAARMVSGLAGWRKLTPPMLKSCAARYKDVERPEVLDRAAALYSPHGICMRSLFAGYHCIKRDHGALEANNCFPEGLLDHVQQYMRFYRGEAVAATSTAQEEVSQELLNMGLPNTLKPLLEGGVYDADIALHAKKIVILVDNAASRSVNSPHRLLGHAVLRQQQLEDLQIKVIRIQEVDWRNTEPEKRSKFLSKVFADHQVKIATLLRAAKKQSAHEESLRLLDEDPPIESIAKWAADRVLVTNGLNKKKVTELAKSRGVFDDVQALEAMQKFRKGRRRTRSKQDVVHALVAFEAMSLYQIGS